MSKNIFNNTLINSTNIDPVYSTLTANAALNTSTLTTVQTIALNTSLGLSSEISNRTTADTLLSNNLDTTNLNVANNLMISNLVFSSGLFYRVYTGFNASVVIFTNSSLQYLGSTGYTGYSTNFSSLTLATSSNILNENTNAYTIEWNGFFLCNSTGIWTVKLSSDDSSFMWIGENAKVNSSLNTFINNGGSHGITLVSNTISLISGYYYHLLKN